MDEESNDLQEVQTPVEDTTSENNEYAEVQQQDKLKELSAQKAHWREKALKEAETRKKLEAELEKIKPKEVKEVQPSTNYITKDEYEEGILRTSKGYSDEDISVLNVISKGKGVSILQAEQDPMFKLHLGSKAEADRKAKAQLGASKGSSSTGSRKEPVTREEHMEMWKEKLGK